MNYEAELISHLNNEEGNLEAEYSEDSASSSDAYHETMALAKSDDFHKQLLAIVLFHQVTIELMKRILIYTNFLEKLCLYPNIKVHNKISKDVSYSEIVKRFKFSIDFKNKQKLISNFEIINKTRNKYAHNIVVDHNIYSYNEIKDFDTYKLFDSTFTLFQEANTDIREKIRVAKKNPAIINLLK